MAVGLLPGMNPCEKCVVFTSIIIVFSMLMLLIIWDILFALAAPEFWVKVPDIEGLDRSIDATAPPTFNITLRVNNEGNRFREMCRKGGRVDVAYEDMPLTHGQLLDFCVPPGVVGVVGSVPVVVAGERLGLPDKL